MMECLKQWSIIQRSSRKMIYEKNCSFQNYGQFEGQKGHYPKKRAMWWCNSGGWTGGDSWQTWTIIYQQSTGPSIILWKSQIWKVGSNVMRCTEIDVPISVTRIWWDTHTRVIRMGRYNKLFQARAGQGSESNLLTYLTEEAQPKGMHIG